MRVLDEVTKGGRTMHLQNQFSQRPNTLILIILNFSSFLEGVRHPLLPNSLVALDSAILRAEFSHLLIKHVFQRTSLNRSSHQTQLTSSLIFELFFS